MAPHKLVIVESPAKAKTIAGYLGPGYVVESSIGHIRDLPQSAAEIPASIKGEKWARLGVDVDNDFTPYYVVSRDKKSHMTKLKALLKDADELYLATDEDREGEAIAWHLQEELKPKVPVHRMVFHEITKTAIQEAVNNPRALDLDLVEAQEARRILDRLYGYEVSPVLWKKIMSGLSAGRVQSVATRLVVDRERERMAFRMASYWDIEGTFDAGEKHSDRMFPAKLYSVEGARVARGSDFNSLGELKVSTGSTTNAGVAHLDRARAEALVSALADTSFEVRSVESKPYRRSPYAPFRTTTLQQEASRKLGFGASRTMGVAQRLYENGFITYMRTDSITLSESAISAARSQVRDLYGAEFLPDAPRTYVSKVKNAQEAHEAIRPAGESFRTPAQTGLTGDEFRLYELIWMRTVASQMKDAVGQSVSVRLGGAAATGEDVVFAASGRVITFHGFLKAYVEGSDEPDGEKDDAQTRLPNVQEGDAVSAAALKAAGHETKAPARYTEATLIRELEEREIGRPSTYASIIGTILNRGYVYKKGTALVPAWLAFSVIRLLEDHFSQLVSYEFTAGMEDILDEIAGGRRNRVSELGRFYFGTDNGTTTPGLHKLVTELGEIDARELATFPIGEGVNLRVGKYGPYIETTAGDRANVPDDLPPDELTPEKAAELLATPAGAETELGADPESGLMIVAKNGRFGPYVTEVIPEDAPKSKKAAHLVAVQDDDHRHDQPRAGAAAAHPAARGRRRPRVGRRDHRAERPLRPVPQEGHRLALHRLRGQAPHDVARGGAGDLRPAQGPRPRCREPRSRDRRGPDQRSQDHREGRPLRCLRHRRRVQRHAACRRRREHRDAGARPRAARRAQGEGTGQEGREEDHEEDHEEDCEEVDGEEGRQEGCG